METLVVGDLHGQVEIAEKALSFGTPVIFIGDYLDSFTRSYEDQIRTLQVIIEAVRDGKATALYGNHEWSYLDPKMQCSGYNYHTARMVPHLDTDVLKEYVFAEGFLISHAGVSKKLLDAREQTLEEYLEAGEFKQIGRSRGGRDRVGGLFWADWNKDFEPLEDQPQIVGHTRGNIIRQKGNSYCIDVLEDYCPQGVVINNGSLEIVEFA